MSGIWSSTSRRWFPRCPPSWPICTAAAAQASRPCPPEGAACASWLDRPTEDRLGPGRLQEVPHHGATRHAVRAVAPADSDEPSRRHAGTRLAASRSPSPRGPSISGTPRTWSADRSRSAARAGRGSCGTRRRTEPHARPVLRGSRPSPYAAGGSSAQNSPRPSPPGSTTTGRGWAGRPSRRSGPDAAATAGAVSASQPRNRSAASR